MPDKPTPKRCAIYTRKSTEEGLDQEFNSLDAQRDAGEAYITSQRHEGWTVLPTRYDDGGFSGGTMDRPALKRLMAEIEQGKVDVVVVYKVDRLSRSLLDFARIIEVFERYSVSFVSVTQQFSTASSLGRLVLNILLSFAQFEREMIAERTRDKMGAARRKGKWVGGRPPFGYDVISGKLVVNADEAAQVRAMFQLYLEERSILRVAEIVNGRGWRMKCWLTKKGARCESGPWDKSAVRRLLTNATYIGKVEYGGQLYHGEHQPIVDQEIFERAATLLATATANRGDSPRNRHGFILRGLVRCIACGSVMTSYISSPRGKTYRYYACTAVSRRGSRQCPVRSVPAEALERFVVERISVIGRSPELAEAVVSAVAEQHQAERPELIREQRQLTVEHERISAEATNLIAVLADNRAGDARFITARLADIEAREAQLERRLAEINDALVAMEQSTIAVEDVTTALSLFEPVWEALTSREQERLLHLLIERVDYDGRPGEIGILFRPAGLACLGRESLRPTGAA
jgi:site-specific DNA recombinase